MNTQVFVCYKTKEASFVTDEYLHGLIYHSSLLLYYYILEGLWFNVQSYAHLHDSFLLFPLQLQVATAWPQRMDSRIINDAIQHLVLSSSQQIPIIWYRRDSSIHHLLRLKMTEVHMRNVHHQKFLQFIDAVTHTSVHVDPTHYLGEWLKTLVCSLMYRGKIVVHY